MRTWTRITTLLLFAFAFGCKPTTQSRILETGGDPATWRVAGTLSARGDLKMDRSGTGATEATTRFKRVDLQVATAPDGSIQQTRFFAKKWIALADGSQDLTFNILMETEGSGSCYANGSRLSGTSEAVYCRNDGSAPVFGPETREVAVRKAQKETCDRLSRLKIDPDRSGYFSKYTASDDTGCVCLNGRERTIRYDDQRDKEPKDAGQAFEAKCRAKEPSTSGGTLTSDEKNYNACTDVAMVATWKQNRTDVKAEVTQCACATEKLSYNDSRYVDDAAGFDKQCRTLADVKEPEPTPTPSPTDATGKPTTAGTTTDAATIRAMQDDCTGRGRYDKGMYCDCRDDGIEVARTKSYSSYESLVAFKGDLDRLNCGD